MEANFNTSHKSEFRFGIMLGVLLVLVGGILFGINMGYIPESFKQVLWSWQMLLVVIGIMSLFGRHIFFGLFLTFAGGLLLIPKLSVVFPNVFPDNLKLLYIPLLLSMTGIIILVYVIYKRKRGWKNEPCCKKQTTKHTIEGDFSEVNAFSKGEYIVLEPEFRGGTIKTTFGATEVDLRKTSLPEGDTYLDITVVFGGVILYIPDEWRVKLQVELSFSGIDDKRRTSASIDNSKRLILVGSCLFGGCEIKN